MAHRYRRCTTRTLIPILLAGLLASGALLSGFGRGSAMDTCSDEPALRELIAGNTQFALDLYRALRTQPGDLFFSPHSISVALAMTYAGAKGETASQMRTTLHFTLPEEMFHSTFHALDSILIDRTAGERGLQLSLANAVWGQKEHPFLPAYMALLANAYEATIERADFAANPEGARRDVNDWVLRLTKGKIEELLAPSMVTYDTRLVLVNAIYFYGMWKAQFDKSKTTLAPFYLLDANQVSVPMMQRKALYNYAEGPDYRAIELPYTGETLSMVILLPTPGSFETFEPGLNVERLTAILGQLRFQEVGLRLPRFKLESEFSLADTLAALGMPAAFRPRVADFSGMDGTQNLFIDYVVHKAFVSVNEEGTEAAAATGVGMRLCLPITMTVDHPFLLLVRDVETGAILFMGRVVDPSAG